MDKNVIELKYSNTNTYLIRGLRGWLLWDTGWAGTFRAFCSALGEGGVDMKDITHLMVSHFHPDHMGIAGEIAKQGVQVVIADVQQDFVHLPDAIFAKEKNADYVPVEDTSLRVISIPESREFLREIGIDGEVFHTPGHTEDSISLMLDSGELFVGDLNPLYELELHHGTVIGQSWEVLLKRNPHCVYYGHAKTAVLDAEPITKEKKENSSAYTGSQIQTNVVQKDNQKGTKDKAEKELYDLVRRIMKMIDRGHSLERIEKKTGADATFVEDVARMYLTHQNVGVQGILDRIEIKGR